MYGNHSNRKKSVRKKEKQVWKELHPKQPRRKAKIQETILGFNKLLSILWIQYQANTHTPVTCKNQKGFHNEVATVDNQMGGFSTNCHFINEWWCGKMNSNKISPHKINNDLNNYISSLHNNKKPQSYAAAVTSTLGDSITRLSTLTNKFKELLSNKTNIIPVGHPNSAATSMFLVNKHKYLGKELGHEEINVGWQARYAIT